MASILGFGDWILWKEQRICKLARVEEGKCRSKDDFLEDRAGIGYEKKKKKLISLNPGVN